jgi:pyruvate/2-oxoglutarate dehydrogenase complex dihydrolipoamide acyltransferase (E2) component
MDFILPDLRGVPDWTGGEAAAEVEVDRWVVNDGALVEKDQEVIEVVLDKVTVTIPAPASGIVRQRVHRGDLVNSGDLLATIEEP